MPIETNISLIQNAYMNSKGNHQKKLWDYYIGDKSAISVYSRKSPSPLKEKTHTSVHVDFIGDIIDIKQGYMGEDIQITPSEENDDLKDKLKEFTINTRLATQNSQSIEFSSVEGISHRLCYTEDGVFKTKNLHGFQVVYEYENDLYNPSRAYYFFAEEDMEGEKHNYCNVYDKEYVYYYREDENRKKKRSTTQDAGSNHYVYVDEQLHNFNEIPIIPFLNNSNWEGDCDKALDLMDLYDEILSDTGGELKAARLAYLKIWGDLYTGTYSDGTEISIPDYLREFGTMLFGTDQAGNQLGNAEFLEKKLDDTAITNYLDRLRSHIFEVSGSIDLRELAQANSQRVFSVKASLMRLESNSMTSENYLKLGLQKLLRLWTFWLGEYDGMSGVDEYDFDIQVGRVFPTDELAQADIATKLSAVMAPRDAYRIAGFEDYEAIAERWAEEGGIGISLALPEVEGE